MDEPAMSMDVFELPQTPKVLKIYLELSQYPILADKIRERMRVEIFARGIISPEQFEREVVEKAILSQKREGIYDPTVEEPVDTWLQRTAQIRNQLTDFYFAYNIPHSDFEEIVRRIITDRKPVQDEMLITFNPELAPWALLFAQGEKYEALPLEERKQVAHHLEEIIVVLIKAMISDQLAFVGVAKDFFTIKDLQDIRRRRFGRGKIGGKAAGMMLAYKILKSLEEDEEQPLKAQVTIPDSYFIGADVHYDFYSTNNLHHFLNQKYRPPEEIKRDFPKIVETFSMGKLPPYLVAHLRELLKELGKAPLIVRSSSLLEDSFGKSFAGKYESVFCPNQGNPDQNLEELLKAIRLVYASALSPDALLYRRNAGLLDYDERMAVLIQRVEGEPYRHYFFPTVSGVAFSRNPFRWNSRIRLEDGFLRMVCGLGTRAVDRVGGEYPRMVALSHPRLRPERDAAQIRKYSQHYIDLIDLEANRFVTLPVKKVLGSDYPSLRVIVSLDKGDHLQPIVGLPLGLSPDDFVLTFDNLLADADFVGSMRTILKVLEERYRRPVDVEFTLSIQQSRSSPRMAIRLLQCRPLSSSQEWDAEAIIPERVAEEDIFFRTCGMVPQGIVSDIEYVVYADPRGYAHIADHTTRLEIGRVIGRLNKKLEAHRFILMGPGRWGTSSIDLGIKVTYADIYNTKALVEIGFKDQGSTPELSFGTHFFQDLIEAKIYPLPLLPDDPGCYLNLSLIDEAPNKLAQFLPEDERFAPYLKVLHIPTIANGRRLKIVMNSEAEQALAFLNSH